MKKNIAVIFGSMSTEHEVSCMSAASILENINNEKYNVFNIGIDKKGTWFNYSGSIDNIKQNKWIQDEENKKKITDIIQELKKYDVVFPVLHGKYGEDGTIQGIFEMAGVKYVGNKVMQSSVAMDKIITKKIVSLENVPVVDYMVITTDDFHALVRDRRKVQRLKDKINNQFGYPIIVKPNRSGSSYGVVKVDDEKQLLHSFKEALKYDNKLLLEKYIGNKHEVECAIIENKGKIYASTPGEIISANQIYDYDAKYENQATTYKVPADITMEQIEDIRQYSKQIYKILDLDELVRVDFFVDDNGKIYFNEVNTMPGFTTISMYPKLLIHDGINYDEIIDMLIENA